MFAPLLLLSLYLRPPTWAPPEIPPPLSDLDHFPSAAVCDGQLAFLAARREWLDNLHGLYPERQYQPWFDAAVADVEDRRAPWQKLHEAYAWLENERREEWFSGPGVSRHQIWDGPQPGECRNALAELRALLGEREFAGGVMPALIGRAFLRPAD